MKILHTADWHLGKKLESFSRLDEQRLVLDEICIIAQTQNVDAVIVAGDLFDNFNPSAEAQELLYSTLHRLSDGGRRLVVAIAGNHDSPERIEVPDTFARICGILFVGYPNTEIKPFETLSGLKVTKTDKGFAEFQLPNCTFPLRLLLTPYTNEIRLKTYLKDGNSEESLRQVLAKHWQELADNYCNELGINMLVTHLYMMQEHDPSPPEEPEDERPILHVGGAQAVFATNVPTQMQYVALGHLHRYQTIARQPCPMVYSSSPLAYSFAEANQVKNVVIIEAIPSQPVSYKSIPLNAGKPLLRGRFEDVSAALTWLADNQNAWVQLTMVTDNYLESADKKRLMAAHDGIIGIIPEIKNSKKIATFNQSADLQTQTMEEIFIDYFKTRKESAGQAPSESLLSLFKEILDSENIEAS
jgi:DNA repair protein SbcD/Mre11